MKAPENVFKRLAKFMLLVCAPIAIPAFGDSIVSGYLQVFDYQLPDGSRVVVRERTDNALPAIVQAELARRHSGQPFVQRQTAHGWLTSFETDGRLETVQVKRGADRTRLLRMSWMPASSNQRAGAMRAPAWWPRLTEPWVRTSVDGHVRTRTMLGWHNQSLARTGQLISSAAARAGLTLLSNRLAAVNEGDYQSGRWLVFAGGRQELVVTLSALATKTGVVAHLRERQQ